MKSILFTLALAIPGAAIAETTVLCADSRSKEGYYNDYFTAVDNLNEKLKLYSNAQWISAPTITFAPDNSSKVVVCVTIKK